MAKLTKPCPVDAKDVAFLIGKDYCDNVVDVPISSLPDFPEVDIESALQTSPTIRWLKAKDAQLTSLYEVLKERLDNMALNIDIKGAIESLEELNLCNVKVTLCEVEGDTTFHGNVNVDETLTAQDIVTDNITVNDTATINNEEVNTSHISELTSDDATIERLTVNESIDDKGTLNVEWLTTTNGIENNGNFSNTGNIETNSIQAETGEIKTLVSDDITVNNKFESLGDTITNWITNTWDITTDTLVVNEKATVKWDLQVDGKTDVQELEVNGKADFREDVKVYDDFYVSGDTTLNGDTKINGWLTVNGDETHNGDAVFNGDVQITWTLTADSLDIDISEYQKKDEKGVASGYASLDNTGKVPMSQLPNISGGVVYRGGWDASTGSYPSNPSNGDMYYCTTAGTVSGHAYNVGDRIIYDADNNRWDVLPDNYGVQSVNGRSGIVVDVQDTTDRKDTVDLTTPATTKYLSEKAVADLINPLIQRIEDLEEETAKTTVVSLDSTSGLPATMNAWQAYTVPFQNLTSTDHIVILDTVTNGNIVITPGNGQISIVSSANESNPVVNVLVIKGA